MAVATHEAWSIAGTAKAPPIPKQSKKVLSDAMNNGRINVDDANERMVREFSEKYGIPQK